MNLFEKLKQFKRIEPDPAFSEKSKRMIFAATLTASPASISRTGTIRTLLRVLETGVAVVLTGFFILLITGGFAGSRISPVNFSSVDPQSLHAEAQAIDIQIQLAHVNYSEDAAPAESTESTAPAASANSLVAETSSAISAAATSSSATGAAATTSATSTSSSSISIDQALLELSK